MASAATWHLRSPAELSAIAAEPNLSRRTSVSNRLQLPAARSKSKTRSKSNSTSGRQTSSPRNEQHAVPSIPRSRCDRMRVMKGCVPVSVLLAALAVAGVISAQSGKAAPARKAVVVELFTSEGCSDCPPADALLARLRQPPSAGGVEVITLGLHVDYWNHQGWTDRFSSAAYSERQLRYVQKLHLPDAYTPQMIVDGVSQFVGNNPQLAAQAIREAARHPQSADVQIQANDTQLQVTVKAPPEASSEVMLALTEDNLASKITAGENNKRELRHAAVVRELRSLGRLRNGSFAAGVSLDLRKDWKRDDLRAVVFVQEPNNGPIDGAASLQLAAKSTAAK